MSPEERAEQLLKWWGISYENQWQVPRDEMFYNIRGVIRQAAEEARKEEREACAELVYNKWYPELRAAAEAIRARDS